MKCAGVYACVKTGCITAAPTNTSGTLTCTDTGAVIRYTLDGSDPRYSDSAKDYVSAVTPAKGETLRAYAKASGKYPSALI